MFWSLHVRENNTFRIGDMLTSRHMMTSLEDIMKEGNITKLSRGESGRSTLHVFVDNAVKQNGRYVTKMFSNEMINDRTKMIPYVL